MCSGTMQSNRAHQNHHDHSFCLCTTCVCFEPLRQKGGASGGNSKHIGGLPVVSPGTVFQWSVLGWCASGQSWDSVPVVSPGPVWGKIHWQDLGLKLPLARPAVKWYTGMERKWLKCRSWSQMVAHTDVSPCPVEWTSEFRLRIFCWCFCLGLGSVSWVERKVCDLKGCCFEITFYFLRSCRYTLQLLCVFLLLLVSIQTSFFSFFLFFLSFLWWGKIGVFSIKLFLKIIYTFVPWVTALWYDTVLALLMLWGFQVNIDGKTFFLWMHSQRGQSLCYNFYWGYKLFVFVILHSFISDTLFCGL